MRFELVLAHTLDPSGPFRAADPTEKYLQPKAQPAEISVEKMQILGPASPTCAFWMQIIFWILNLVRDRQTPSYGATNRYIALWNSLKTNEATDLLTFFSVNKKIK